MSVAMENRWKRRLIAENNAINDRRRELEALRLVRAPRAAQTIARETKNPTRRAMRRLMRLHAGEYETATELAEAANIALNLPQEWLDDEGHWVWDEAAREHEI
jgi:hypothetical protein